MIATAQQAVCLICSHEAAPYCVKGPAHYHACPQCGTIFQWPMPSLQQMAEYADQEYRDGVYADYVRARDLKLTTFRHRMRTIRRLASGHLLDVGAACGYLVEVALEAGFDAEGVEWSPAAIAAAAEHVRPRLRQGDVN